MIKFINILSTILIISVLTILVLFIIDKYLYGETKKMDDDKNISIIEEMYNYILKDYKLIIVLSLFFGLYLLF